MKAQYHFRVTTHDRRTRLIRVAVLGIALACISLGLAMARLQTDEKEKVVMSLTLTSPSFMHERIIPLRHTCDGANISPSLAWSGVPAGAKSLALIVDDPDAPDPAAPQMIWAHWLLYNIPSATSGLAEGVALKDLPSGTLHGINDWQRADYRGPCPPVGQHRSFFKLYALDTVLPDLKQPTKAILEKSMQGHVLAYTELMGLYQRQ